jgi:hypothetical protein
MGQALMLFQQLQHQVLMLKVFVVLLTARECQSQVLWGTRVCIQPLQLHHHCVVSLGHHLERLLGHHN